MRSTFAAVLALALLALGPTAGVARADETAEPTASAKASEPDKPAKEDDADSDKSDDADKSEKPDAKESEAPKPSQTRLVRSSSIFATCNSRRAWLCASRMRSSLSIG